MMRSSTLQTPPLIIAPPVSDLPRILANFCALHHISEKYDDVVIRTDEITRPRATIDVPLQSPCCPFRRHRFDLNWRYSKGARPASHGDAAGGVSKKTGKSTC